MVFPLKARKVLFFLYLVGVLQIVAERSRFGCRDQNNNPVDWWAGYKVPEQKNSASESVSQGYGFFYLDQRSPSQWVMSQTDVSLPEQALAYTLQQLYDYKNDADVFHLLYNDEIPNGTYSLTSGHTKGVLLFDRSDGFWLIHSIPKFPVADKYVYAQNARRYGQSMLCISFSYSELKNIDLYYDLVAPSLQVSLKSETWQHGANENLLSWCHGQYNVHNVRDVSLPNNISFPNYDDHSKWAVADVDSSSSEHFVCIGDINRQRGQLHRGGGTMCMLNKQVWKVYSSTVADEWPCD